MKKNKKYGKTSLLAAALGLLTAAVLMAAKICLGYRDARAGGAETATVSLFGLDIYYLVRPGSRYFGSPVRRNMGILSLLFLAAAVCAERGIAGLRHRKRKPEG